MKIELLAPAGDKLKLKTAFMYGADACYFAGKKYGLRAFSDNFDDDELKQSVEYAHSLNKKCYITLNILAHNPDFDGMQNVMGSIHVLEQARRFGVKRVIFASTAAAYGDVSEERLPIGEFESLKPLSFYGLSKMTVERYLDLYHRAYGIDYVVLRFANVYGERQGNGGEGGVVSIFTKQIKQGKDITICGDGKQTRDFIYAGDIAHGIAAALRTDHANRAYNLSTQQETSLNELVELLSLIAGRKIHPRYAKGRPGDIYHSLLANGRARRFLLWSPSVSLEEGLRRTYAAVK